MSQNMSQITAATVKNAFQILGKEAGIHPQLSAEAFEVTAHLTPIVEEASEIEKQELEEFLRDFENFLEDQGEGELNPLVIPLGLWLALLPAKEEQKPATEKADPMFA